MRSPTLSHGVSFSARRFSDRLPSRGSIAVPPPREDPIRTAKVWWRLPVVHSPGCSRGLVEPLWSSVITAVFANQEWCRRGGNGRRSDLAGLWAQARVSSNLTAGTAAPLSRTRDGCKLSIPVRFQWRFRYAKPESHALRLFFTATIFFQDVRVATRLTVTRSDVPASEPVRVAERGGEALHLVAHRHNMSCRQQILE